MLTGMGVSKGIGLAEAMVWHNPVVADFIPHKSASPEFEIRRFEAAREALLSKTEELREKTARHFGDDEALIFDAYRMMLEDEEGLASPIRMLITEHRYSAEHAVTVKLNDLATVFLGMDDDYLRQRSADAYDLRDQLLREMMGVSPADASHLDHPTIIVAYVLSPSDLAGFDLSRLEGIICEVGGYSTHAAIMARTLGIPMVTGAARATEQIGDGELIALDGDSGEVWMSPDEDEISELQHRTETLADVRAQAQTFRGLPTISTDGRRIELSANIGQLDDMDAVLAADAESVGLFRTELMMIKGQQPPSEEDQFRAYKAALEKIAGKAVTVRTFDDGGTAASSTFKTRKEDNPVMGCRGIRMSLGRPSFFRTQLRALLRASAYGNLRIMLPMVSTLDELDEALHAVENVKKELRRENIPFDEKLPLGILIEVPTAALLADVFATRVDFFSIGINDLIQFTLAVDRGNPNLTYLYQQYHPAILRLIHLTVEAAHKQGIPCNLCGEAPGQEQALPLLLGLGLDGFSLNPGTILAARQILNSCNFAECKQLADETLQLGSTSEVAKHLAFRYA